MKSNRHAEQTESANPRICDVLSSWGRRKDSFCHHSIEHETQEIIPVNASSLTKRT